MRFKDALVDAIESRDRTKLREVEPEPYLDRTAPSRPDGNNVSMHSELGKLSQNELLFRVSVRALNTKYKWLKKAIRGQ